MTGLAGKRVVLTRPRGQSGVLAAKLRELGAITIDFPTIEIRPAPDYGPLDLAIRNLHVYDWIIFTSANGVRFFRERLAATGTSLRGLRARVCAIGPATRKAAEDLGLAVDTMPQEYVAESLVATLSGNDLQGKRILLPRALVARDVAPAELARQGARVDLVEAYRTVVPEGAAQRAREIFLAGSKPDWVTFTSSSTVANFAETAGVEVLEGVRVASIGPVTSATARKLGIAVDVEASPYTTDGLVAAMLSAA